MMLSSPQVRRWDREQMLPVGVPSLLRAAGQRVEHAVEEQLVVAAEHLLDQVREPQLAVQELSCSVDTQQDVISPPSSVHSFLEAMLDPDFEPPRMPGSDRDALIELLSCRAEAILDPGGGKHVFDHANPVLPQGFGELAPPFSSGQAGRIEHAYLAWPSSS